MWSCPQASRSSPRLLTFHALASRPQDSGPHRHCHYGVPRGSTGTHPQCPSELEMKSVAESVGEASSHCYSFLDGVDGRFTKVFIKDFEWFLSNGSITDL